MARRGGEEGSGRGGAGGGTRGAQGAPVAAGFEGAPAAREGSEPLEVCPGAELEGVRFRRAKGGLGYRIPAERPVERGLEPPLRLADSRS